jgi:hypothetical protein
MSTEEPESPETSAPRRGPRAPGASGRPAGNIAALVIAVVAVILSFVVLNDIADSQESSSPVTTTTTAAPTTTSAPTTTLPPTTTLAPINKTGYKILVANASGVPASPGQLTIALKGQGFIVEPATNASHVFRDEATTRVLYLAGNEENATSVARVLGGVCIEPMVTPVPTERASLGEASVLVMLGKDLAGLPLPETADSACTAG